MVDSSFIQSPAFYYFNPDSRSETLPQYSGLLEIHVHHARNIHNICIYDNQDVYAKFSLTYNPDVTISTRIANRGGKNPEFDQDLILKVSKADAVLKCEIWMLSRAKNLMEDQLLGFALVPLSSVLGKGKVTQDFSLSSTDLFHSPAGTIKLSLSLNTNWPLDPPLHLSSANSQTTSELELLSKKVSESDLGPAAEYSRIEFPDINVVKENQQMLSEYFDNCSFLHLGANHPPVVDCEMAVNTVCVSPTGSIHNSGFLSSTMTSLSDDRNSVNSPDENDNNNNMVGADSLETSCNKELDISRKEEGMIGDESNGGGAVEVVQAYSATPENSINSDAEQTSMQQQIVDMYMKSMQQFSESLEKMKLPMDLDTQVGKEKKDCSRVFYGSRAFF